MVGLDSAARLVWWDVLSNRSDDAIPTLQRLLDHGADRKLRHPEGNAVGCSAHRKNWPAVWLLMESGVEWKNEKQFGQPVAALVAYDYAYRSGVNHKIPAALGKAMEKFKPSLPDAASTSRQ